LAPLILSIDLTDTQLSEQIDTVLLPWALVAIMTLVAELHFEACFESGAAFSIAEYSDIASEALTDNLAESEPEPHAMRVQAATPLDDHEG